MLARPDVEVVYDEAGTAVGVKSEGETARAKFVVGDPTYFPDKVGGPRAGECAINVRCTM